MSWSHYLEMELHLSPQLVNSTTSQPRMRIMNRNETIQIVVPSIRDYEYILYKDLKQNKN